MSRVVKVQRHGLWLHWEAWLRGQSGTGPVLRGRSLTRRRAERAASTAQLTFMRRPTSYQP